MAGKLIITRGLPASGKSTYAEVLRGTYEDLGQSCRIVTMDDIRTAIGAVFEDGDESIVQSIRNYTIREYLRKHYIVISADTNLAPRTFDMLMQISLNEGADYEVLDFTHVSLETCLARNAERWARGDCKVPDQAIVKMHERYLSNA